MFQERALHNAAALMLLLGDAEAGAVMRELKDGQVQALKQAIAKIDASHRILGPQARNTGQPGLGVVDVDVAIDMPGDVAAGAAGSSRLLSDASQYVRSLLHQAFGTASVASAPSTSSPLGRPRPPSGIQSAHNTDLAGLAQMLASEHPQIAAAVLAWLEPDTAARALHLIPPRQRSDMMLRIATLGPIRPGTAQALDAALADLLGEQAQRRDGPQGGVKAVADMLGRMGAHMEGVVLEAIRAQDPDLARRIEDRMPGYVASQVAKA
jgi:flagellar motor switch protein FliG